MSGRHLALRQFSAEFLSCNTRLVRQELTKRRWSRMAGLGQAKFAQARSLIAVGYDLVVRHEGVLKLFRTELGGMQVDIALPGA